MSKFSDLTEAEIQQRIDALWEQREELKTLQKELVTELEQRALLKSKLVDTVAVALAKASAEQRAQILTALGIDPQAALGTPGAR